jgi:hypothetical protein
MNELTLMIEKYIHYFTIELEKLSVYDILYLILIVVIIRAFLSIDVIMRDRDL